MSLRTRLALAFALVSLLVAASTGLLSIRAAASRIYRAPAARSRPGSGLGLAIVRDVAESHDGDVFVLAPPGGGALLGLSVGPGRLVRPTGTGGSAGPGEQAHTALTRR